MIAMGLYVLLRRNHSGGMRDSDRQRVWETQWMGYPEQKSFFHIICHRLYRYSRAFRTDYFSALPAHQQGHADGIHWSGLVLLFIGGALGKFICGVLAEKIGIIPSITITEAITGLGIIYLYGSSLSGNFSLPAIAGYCA